MTSVTWGSFDSLKLAPPLMHHWASKTDGAGTRVQRRRRRRRRFLLPREKPWRESSVWLWEGTLAEGGNGTHREKQRLPQDGVSGYLQLPTTVVQEGLVAAGSLRGFAGGSSGSRSQGISLALSQEGHLEPAFPEDIAARRKDPDF